MPRLFLLFNHYPLTPEQQSDARTSLGVEEVITPPEKIRSLWSQFPPDAKGLASLLQPVRDWLVTAAIPGDLVLIQGDFGACYLMISFAMSQDLIPIYSTTERQAFEERLDDGSVHLVHRFRHVRFRLYGD